MSVIFADGADFSGAGGDGVHVEGGAIFGSFKTNNCGGSGVVLKDGAYAAMPNPESNNNNDAGFRVKNADFVMKNPQAHGNRIGLDLHQGARGDIFGGDFRDNSDADIRYRHDVLAGIFDTAAEDVLDQTRGAGLRDVEAEWIANELLWTTDLGLKARKTEKLAKKAAIAGIASPAIAEAYELAKSIFGI